MSVSGSTEASQGSPNGNEQHRISCVTCKKRKIKCDRLFPCINCERKHIECVYLTSTKRRTRGPGKQRASERIELMTSRVSQLEQVIEKLQSHTQVENPPSRGENSAKAVPKLGVLAEDRSQDGESLKGGEIQESEAEEDDLEPSQSHLLVKGGRSRYIRNKFWASINTELGDAEELLGEEARVPSNQKGSPHLNHATSSSHSLLFGSFGAFGGPMDLSMLRPPSLQISLYWKFYVENVGPVYKILHNPSTEQIIRSASVNSSLSPSNEALLFAIYFAAIISLPAEDVERIFQDNKNQLINRYRYAVEQSLARAGLLNTQEISTLQAFVIFIICIRRHEDSRTIWTMVGLANRIALGMGMQHDGSKFKITPWATEMRRRLWWHIYGLDVLTAEDQGCEVTITRDSFDTKMPLNINDEDLDVNAIELPPNRLGVTEISASLMRFEIIETCHAIQTVDYGLNCRTQNHQALTMREKLDIIKLCERKLHQNYLQYYSPDIPTTVLMYVIAKVIIAKHSLMVHYPQHRTPQAKESSKPVLSRDELFVMSISVIEGSQLLESAPALKQWAWIARKCVQWHAVAYVLTELCSTSRPPGALVDRAWRAIDGLAPDTVEMMADRTNAAIYRPIQTLLAQARQRRFELKQRPEKQIDSRVVEFDQWNLVQDVGPTCENFDWFLSATGSSHDLMILGENYAQQLQTPISLPVADIEFWNDMDGIFPCQTGDNNGAISGGEMSDWW